jgi:hypothetical protein
LSGDTSERHGIFKLTYKDMFISQYLNYAIT